MVYYRQHESNLTATVCRNDFNTMVIEDAVNKWGLQGPDGRVTKRAKIKKHLNRLSFGFGYEHFWNGDLLIAKQSLIKSVTTYPFYIKPWIYLFLTLLRLISKNFNVKLKKL